MEIEDAQKLWDAEPGWLNTASYGLPPRPAFEELQTALGDWRAGRTSWEPWGESAVRAREAFARLAAPGVEVRTGRVRASFHVYSTEADVDLAVEALTGL